MVHNTLKPGMEVVLNTGEICEIYEVDYHSRSFCYKEFDGKEIIKYWCPLNLIDWKKTEELNKTTARPDAVLVRPDAIKPNHYKMCIKGVDMEVDDIIKAVLTSEQYQGWLHGNTIKYCLRALKKNGLEDFKKDSNYLDRLIKKLEEEE